MTMYYEASFIEPHPSSVVCTHLHELHPSKCCFEGL